MPSLEKRKDGGWSISYVNGSGKRTRVSLKSLAGRAIVDEADAEAIYHKWLIKNVVTEYSPAPRETLEDLFRVYDSYVSKRWSPESYRVDMPRLKDFLQFAAEQGAKFADQVKPMLLEDYRTELLGRGMAPQTANKYLERVRAFFNRLKALHLVDKSPVEGIEMQKTHKPEMRLLTDDEIRRLYQVIEGDIADVVTVALQTGMRQSEICRMRWYDVKPDGIHIPKTKSYRPRTIPYAPCVKSLLEQRREDIKNTPSYVFGDRSGEPVPGQVWYLKLMGGYMRAGIEGANFHTLRHTFASRLLRSGANIKVVQTIMGHADLKTTLQYVHLYEDDSKRAMAVLNFPVVAQ